MKDRSFWKDSNIKHVEWLELLEAESYSFEVVEYECQGKLMLRIEREVGLPLVFIDFNLDGLWKQVEKMCEDENE